MEQTTRRSITLSTDTLDQLDAVVERVDGVRQLVTHCCTSETATLPEALDAIADLLIAALLDLRAVAVQLNAGVAQ